MKLNTEAFKRCFLLGWVMFTAQWVWSQSSPVAVPCGGQEIIREDFENGIPVNWNIQDVDGNTPDGTTGLQPGWQIREDYRDSTNSLMVSSSFYSPFAASDDWLITERMPLGDNPCVSWKAYSQDGSFREDYEVRVSNTGNSISDFATVVDTVSAESNQPVDRAIYLPNFANDTVYIAFRQVSNDKFVLALDDILVSNAEVLDIGVSAINFGSPQPGDTSRFQFTVANYGSGNVTGFTTCFQVDGGSINCTTLDTIALSPNQTYSFVHPDSFVFDTLDQFYDLCVWTSAPNAATDELSGNDTLCTQIPIGSPVGVPSPNNPNFEVSIFPNPVQNGRLNLHFGSVKSSAPLHFALYNLQGQQLLEANRRVLSGSQLEMELFHVPAGIYFLELRDQSGGRLVRKIQID